MLTKNSSYSNSKKSFAEQVNIFSVGMGNPTIMIMVLIFILAGIFTTIANSIGAVDSVVKIIQIIIPNNFLILAFFLISSLISLSIGTSCGTIVALSPIAISISQSLNLNETLILGCIIGGAMFGDNLSIISDTTIAAAKTQHIELKDKTKYNFKIVILPVLACIAIYCTKNVQFSTQSISVEQIDLHDYLKIFPYFFLLGLGIYGINVVLLLILGIIANCLLGIFCNSMPIGNTLELICKGALSMSNIIIIALIAGGTFELLYQKRIFKKIIHIFEKLSFQSKYEELFLCIFIGLINLFTANNTISIIVAGPLAYEIGQKHHLDAKRIASLLDITSCVVQGLLPYGAQILIATSLSSKSPIEIIKNTYYPIVLGIFLVLSILLQKKK